MVKARCHPEDLRCCLMSSRWHNIFHVLSHPDELAPGRMSPGWLMINVRWLMNLWYCSMSFGWDNIIWSLSHPDDFAIVTVWSGWLMANVLCHPQDIRSFRMSSWWHSVIYILSHPIELPSGRIASRWFMVNVGCHSDGSSCCPTSSRRYNVFFYPKVIRMT